MGFPGKVAGKALITVGLLFSVSLTTLPAWANPPERRKGILGGERRGQRFERKNNPNFLWQADLTLKRLVASVVLEDPDLSIAQLDEARRLRDELVAWVAEQPAGRRAELTRGIERFDELLRFAQFRLEAEFGLSRDLEAGLAHFVGQDYPVEQKIALLLFAADTQLDRGQLKSAALSVERAIGIAQAKDGPVSPVVDYSLTSLQSKLKVAQQGSMSFEQLNQELARAMTPLASYHAHENPIVDTQWLLGRRATAFWTRQLAAYPDRAAEPLAKLLELQKRLKEEARTPWNAERLAAQGLHFPYDGYFKQLADLTLMTSEIDQMLDVGEALGPHSALRAFEAQQLDQLEQIIGAIPMADALYQNEKLGPDYAEFHLEEASLVHEFFARIKLLKAQRLSDHQAVRQLLKGAADELSFSDDAAERVRYYLQIGDLLHQQSLDPEAVVVWERAWKLSQEQGLPMGVIHSAERLAGYYADKKQPKQTESFARPALGQIENSIPMVSGDSKVADELRQSANKLSGLLARSALAQENPEMAMMALNQGRQYSTAMTQLSAEKDAAPKMNEMQQMHDQMMALSSNVKQLQAMPPSQTRDELLDAGEKLLADSKSEFLLAGRTIRQDNSSLYSSALRFDPLNLPDIQKELPDDTLVVQYFSAEKELYIFLVGAHSLKLFSVPVTKAQLDSECSEFLKSIRRLETASRVVKRSQTLYGWLVAPIQAQIKPGDRLVLIPAEGLTYLPFGALCDAEEKPLLESHPLLELAKPTDFAGISKSKPQRVDSVTAFGNATMDLPESAEEAQAIVKLFDRSQLYLEQNASKANFVAHGAESKALHLATHGQWDTGNPLNSHLELAKGERVSQDEILSLPLDKTALVTLSACNTALAPNPDSDYVASLAEAFWLAGAPTVVATLWSVDDTSTRQLMTQFYGGLKQDKGKADALREAQLALYRSNRYSHPFYWSGFVLFGDWR